MDMKRSLGLQADGSSLVAERRQLIRYINLKLAAVGAAPTPHGDVGDLEVAHDLLAQFREYSRLLENYLCPADQRIQNFLDTHLSPDRLGTHKLNGTIRLPARTFILDRHGLAREMSLPVDADHYGTELLESYRTRQGVLHNPRSDRRTTQGVFHVAEGGLPIPADKTGVPLHVYGNLLHAALNPPRELQRLPFAAAQENAAEVFCSMLLRPVICPEVPGFLPRKTMEVRFFAPGSLVSNLDFVESIFGNAGDPYLPENDAGLDVEHWSGHSGCVILAPHLVKLRKKDVGVPHYDLATPRQREQGMCWKEESELYNNGSAFKITARNADGVMVTILADNYYGYCKKEVKTQISYAANLYGLAEEEHAGGALAFASYSLGDQFRADTRVDRNDEEHSFANMVQRYHSLMDVKPEGYAVDLCFPDIVYVPQDVAMDVKTRKVSWTRDGQQQSINLVPGKVYVHPAGYKVRLEKHPGAPSWRLVGTVAEGTFCHKPCTVSGGGKSEISKSISDSIVYGPLYISDLEKDLDRVQEIFTKDYSGRLLTPFKHDYSTRPSRPPLSPQRSLGSVIKLLTPSPGEFTDEYNAWLTSIPNYIKALVFIIKRFYRPEWGDNWRQYFSVDEVNGAPGHELKFGDRKIVGSYLRVGLSQEGNWRLYKLRQDFIAADKVQMEDDITASVVVPANRLPNRASSYDSASVKLAENCEYRLFQRPDEAIHRGYDKQTEYDMAQLGLFTSNYQPLSQAEAKAIVEDTVEYEKFTEPMKANLRAAAGRAGYVVSSANPRIVDGKLTKNPRYLQTRPDLMKPRDRYLAEIGTRLFRLVPVGEPVMFPVNAVLSGRRNNPAEPAANIRPLAVYNPIHYQELPELFMDYICSLTGKSPSTTGAGSEGALTKGPFNALPMTIDLNNALVSFILTGYAGFSTAAGFIGPDVRVDHDISLLIPEIWTRLPVGDRDPAKLIAAGLLERLDDFDHKGRRVLASRLGYRITSKFVHTFFGKVFDDPSRVFIEPILRPEMQSMEDFVDGIDNIVEAQQRVAKSYFEDGTIDLACPPLRALIHIMAHGSWEGKDASDPGLREMFSREHLLSSDWYQQRVNAKAKREEALWSRHVSYLDQFLCRPSHADVSESLNLGDRLALARRQLQETRSPGYATRFIGTLGADPLQARKAT